MGSKEFMQIIFSGIGSSLLPHGFRHDGTTFFADHAEVSFLISLEKQSTTRKDSVVFSVYVCVYSKVLAQCAREKAGLLDQTEPVKLRWYNCHWRRNIANALGDDQGMKLWRVQSEQQAVDASKEVVEMLQDWGLPHLDRLSSTAKIATFLRDGGGKNITDPRRQDSLRLLEDFLLKRMIGDKPEIMP